MKVKFVPSKDAVAKILLKDLEDAKESLRLAKEAMEAAYSSPLVTLSQEGKEESVRAWNRQLAYYQARYDLFMTTDSPKVLAEFDLDEEG